MSATMPAEPHDATRTTREIRCPADGRLVGTIPLQTKAEVEAMAKELRAAQPGWEALGVEGRKKHLFAWLDWYLDNERRLLEMVQAESGKSWGDASIETTVAIEVINYYAKNAERFLSDRNYRPHTPASIAKKLEVHVRPHQLVGVIIPWNYPLGNPLMDVPQALLAGASVLSKPSEVTPLAWAELVRGWREEIGAPPVLACALGEGETGAHVVDVVDMIHFTGSTRTGKAIGKRAVERMIPASLELGGKDPMIVMDDANIDRAVHGAIWGGLFNAGQSCIAVERLYVQDGVYDAFVSKLTAEVAKLRQGMDEPEEYGTDLGAMATESQLELVDRHVQDAIDKGARVTTGGRRGPTGLFYEPTVLVDVDHTMDCMREETFGPTLPVMRVRDEEEALRLANDSPYGLAGSLWTADKGRGDRMSRRMECGSVSINNALASIFQFPLPMGGWKQSGVGVRFGGPSGILKYCKQQSVCADRIELGNEPYWYPYQPRKAKAIAAVVRLLGAHDWRRRLGRKGKQ